MLNTNAVLINAFAELSSRVENPVENSLLLPKNSFAQTIANLLEINIDVAGQPKIKLPLPQNNNHHKIIKDLPFSDIAQNPLQFFKPKTNNQAGKSDNEVLPTAIAENSETENIVTDLMALLIEQPPNNPILYEHSSFDIYETNENINDKTTVNDIKNDKITANINLDELS